MECEKFWLRCPLSLFNSLDILPEKSMCTSEKLNALTRLAVLISLVLLIAGNDKWYLLLLGTIVFVIVAYFLCNIRKQGFKSIQTLNPIWYHDQSTPIESVDSMCNQDYELVDDTYVNDVQYIDTEYRPRLYFGTSKGLMPDEEDQFENLDRKQLRRLNTEKFANREIEARESIVQIFKKELNERFEPDEYYESY